MTLGIPDRSVQPSPAGILRRYRNALLAVVFLAAVLCIAAGVWWLTRPNPGQGIYDELTAAAENSGSTTYETYRLRPHAAVQVSLAPKKPLEGFAFRVGHWLATLPDVPAGGVNVKFTDNEPAPPPVYARAGKRWVPVTMQGMPHPWRSWDRSHHAIPAVPPPNWFGWKELARTKPPPSEVRVRLPGLYGFLPKNCSGVWIAFDGQRQKITSVAVSCRRSATSWHRSSFAVRRFVQQFVQGRSPYHGQFHLLWWGLVRAGVLPWRASRVIESAALSLLQHSDHQLMRMAFSTDATDLRGATSATSAVQAAILNMSVNLAGRTVFWVTTRHGGRLCFWLQTPFGIRVLHFDRYGHAYTEEGWILPILPPSTAPTQWDRGMPQRVAKFLPFFRTGAPWDVPGSNQNKG